MDKNTIIGLVLILAILFGFSYLNRPSEEEIAARQRYQDSVAMANAEQIKEQIEFEKKQRELDSIALAEHTIDTARALSLYGDFAGVAFGDDSLMTVESDLLRLQFSTRGGRVSSAELKEYRTHDSLPLVLFEGDESEMNFVLLTHNNRVLNTKDLYFKPILTKTDDAQIMTMRLEVDSASHLDFVYTIPDSNYMTRFEIRAHNMAQHLDPRTNSLEMQWKSLIRQQEKGRKFESRYAVLYYKYAGDDVEEMSQNKNDAEKPTGKVRWVAFKDQFFSTIMLADNSFTSTALESEIMPEQSRYIKAYSMDAVVDFDPTGQHPTMMQTYYGPNQHRILKSYDKDLKGDDQLDLEKIIPLGWSLFRWVSQLLIIPMFNFFGRFISNYGIIILLMTIVIKLILLPLTFKSYMSSAKMRVLRPQIEEINARIPAEKAMERNQATMALYQKAGINPMGGCLPLLLQMPILFAMFSFFPTAIELRQQSFLWADDLSSYDAIVSWNTYIPFISSTFGNHISLFCLLMTVTNLIYTKVNMASQPSGGQMAGMNIVMYLMPIMFLFIFNNYASGLSYYYFVSLLITIGQTYLFRLFVDEKKLLKKIEAAKAKPKKKSGFMARLEAAQKAQQEAIRKQQQQQHRKR